MQNSRKKGIRTVKNKSEIEPIKLDKIGAKEHVINDELIKKIALRVKLPVETVEAVIRSQWEFLEHVIQEDKLYSFRIKFLGIFGVKNFKFLYTKKFKNYHVKKEEIIRGVDPILLKTIKDRQDDLQNP